MVILENHFRGKNTYIIGKYISNGCQTFTINKLNKICKEHNVSNEIKEEVLEAYKNNNKTEEDWDVLCKHDVDWSIRWEVAKHNHYNILNYLKDDKEGFIREEVAKHNNPDILDYLKNDIYWSVRYEVAKHYNLDILNYLKNDEDWRVRYEVAKHNNPDILNYLKDDEDADVREQAKKTNSLWNKIKYNIKKLW